MSRKKKDISRNYMVNTIYQLMVVMIPLFTMPHLSRTLGAEGIGLYSFNNSIVSYFVLFAILGSASYGQREIAYHQDNKAEYSKAFWEIFILRIVLSLISLTVFLGYVLILGREKIVLLILSLSILNVILDISWLYVGLEEFSHLAIRNIIVRSFYILFIFTCIRSIDDIYLYILGEVGFNTLQFCLLWTGVRHLVERPRNLHPFSHFRHVFKMFLPSLAIQLYTVLDKTMLGIFSVDSYAENGYYEQAQGIIRSCLVLISSLVTVMSPKISHCFANKEYDEMKKHLYFSYRYVWFITIVLFVSVFILSPFLIPMFLGPQFNKTIILVQVCAPLFMIIGLSNITGLQYFVPTDHIKSHTFSLLVGSCVNICLNLLFIPRFNSVGASFASVIAELCVTTTQFIFLVKIGDLKLHKIFMSSGKYIVAGLVSGILLYVFRINVEMNWFNLAMLLVFEFACYLGLLIIMRDRMVIDYIKSLIARIRGNYNE